MSCSTQKVAPVQVIDFKIIKGRPSQLNLNKKVLKDILSSCGKRPVHVISIAGAARQGKSFLLSVIINVLQYLEEGHADGWQRLLQQDHVAGFEFQNGIDRKTVGFWIWSKPFFLPGKDGQEVAVLVMDTQGVFDSFTNKRDWSMIVGLSLLTSSCVIYNLMNNLQEDALEIFKSFVDFGTLCLEEDSNLQSPFQKLMFVIRDWNMPESCAYGTTGGAQFLQQRLQTTEEMPEELKIVRKTLKTCFEEVSCFLMPFPGESVKTNTYNGNLSILEDEFTQTLGSFVEDLLLPENIKGKVIQGNMVTGAQLFTYFERFVDVFNKTTLPEPKTLLELTVEARLDGIVKSCMEEFEAGLAAQTGNHDFVTDAQIKEVFTQLQQLTKESFDRAVANVNSETAKTKAKNRLAGDLLREYYQFMEVNNKKKQYLQENVVKQTFDSYVEYVQKQIEATPLLPQQLEEVMMEGRKLGNTLIGSLCGVREDHFYAEILQMLDNLVGKANQEFVAVNKTNIEAEQKKCEALVATTTKEYDEEMSYAKLIIGNFTQVRLQEVYKRAEDQVVAKFEESLQTKNEVLRQMSHAQLKANIAQILEKYASEALNHHEQLLHNVNFIVNDAVAELRTGLASYVASGEQRQDLETYYIMQKSVGLQKLNQLYHLVPEQASSFFAFANQEMDNCLRDIKAAIAERKNEEKKRMEQDVKAAAQSFQANLEKTLGNKGFDYDESFKSMCQTLEESALNSKRNLSWTEDKALHSAFQELLLPLLAKVAEAVARQWEAKIESEEFEFTSILRDTLDKHQAYLFDLLQSSVKTKQALESQHKSKMQTYETNLTMFPHLPVKRRSQIITKFQNDLEGTYQLASFHLQTRLQKLENHAKSIESNFLEMYKSQMNILCRSEDIEEAQLGHNHKVTVKNVFDQLNCAYGLPEEVKAQIKQRLHDLMKKEFEARRLALGEKMRSEGEMIEDLIGRCEEDFLSAASEQMSLSHDKAAFTSFLRHKQKSVLDKFDSSFPSQSRKKKAECEKKLKKVLAEQLVDMEHQFANSVAVVEKEIAEEANSLMTKYKKKVEEAVTKDGKKIYMDSSHLRIVHDQVLADVRAQVGIVNLTAPQKEKLLERVGQAASVYFNNLLKETEEKVQKIRDEVIKARYEFLNGLEDNDDAAAIRTNVQANVANNLSKEQVSDDVRKELLDLLNITLQSAQEEAASNKPHESEVELAMRDAKTFYKKEMDRVTADKNHLDPKMLEEHHRKTVSQIKQNLSIKKTTKILQEIDLNLGVAYKKYRDMNAMKSNVAAGLAIGIDLGTTYSCVGVFREGTVDMVPDRNNNKCITPSYVLYKNEEVVVGEMAKAESVLYPTNAVFDAKRLIGKKFADEDVQKDIQLWPFDVVNHEGRPKIKVEDKTYFPEQVSAAVLKKLKDDAEKFLNIQIKKAVITVPAYFSDSQKQATKDAGKVAGLEVLGIVNEPTAAAIAYSLSYKDDKERNVVVYDLGGGTFDVSVLTIKRGKIAVKAVGGDNHLGGQDFDNEMMNHCLAEFQKTTGVDLTEGGRQAVSSCKRRIRHYCEAQKIHLSVSTSVNIVLGSVAPGHDMNVPITRDQFNEMNKKKFESTIEVLKKALAEAKIAPEEINDVILVGGSSRIPKVQELLQQLFPGKHLNMSINPDEVVARGAAIFAAIKNGSMGEGEIQFSDVAPLSLGVKVLGNHFSRIIPKNTKVPVTRTEPYTTVNDNQTAINFEIYEGEEDVATKNNLLGTFTLNGIPAGPKGQETVDITIHCDAEGILNVKAEIKSTKGKKEVKITSKRTNLSEWELENATSGN